MALEINKPGGAKKPKLSKTGKIIIAVAVVCILAICAVTASVVSAGNKKADTERALLETIERGVTVCESALSALDADEGTLSEFDTLTANIGAEKKADKKADAAYDMIDFVLRRAAGNASFTDELNGARNRIFYALKKYNEK
jgi:flagellar basal body-associated protein FliL